MITLAFLVPITYVTLLLIFITKHNHKIGLMREKTAVEEPVGNDSTEGKWEVGNEYISRWSLLGIPLIHFSSGKTVNGSTKAAIGWIAFGQKAYGLLFAAGGFAIAPIAIGGATLGLLVALGGAAVGGIASGGIAIGYVASGGMAMGWALANGGFAVAHQFAVGGLSIAAHTNDAAAHAYASSFSWMDFTNPNVRSTIAFVAWFPLMAMGIYYWRKTARTGAQKKARL